MTAEAVWKTIGVIILAGSAYGWYVAFPKVLECKRPAHYALWGFALLVFAFCGLMGFLIYEG